MKRHILIPGMLYVLFSNNIHAVVKVDFTGGSSISGDLLSWDGEKELSSAISARSRWTKQRSLRIH